MFNVLLVYFAASWQKAAHQSSSNRQSHAPAWGKLQIKSIYHCVLPIDCICNVMLVSLNTIVEVKGGGMYDLHCSQPLGGVKMFWPCFWGAVFLSIFVNGTYYGCESLFFIQLRKLTVEGCQYRSIHQELMRDLLRLSTSTYSQVSSTAHFNKATLWKHSHSF